MIFAFYSNKKEITMKKILFLFIFLSVIIAAEEDLFSVSRSGNHKALKKAISRAENIDIKNKFNKTALMYACNDGDLTAVQMLVEAGAAVNEQDSEGWSPLFYAAANNNLDIVKYLLSKGADKSLTDIGGKRACDYAEKKGYTEIAGLTR